MTYADPVAALTTVLQTQYGGIEPATPPEWSVPHRVLDAVLVLGTDPASLAPSRYPSQVVAPIDAFRRAHPGVQTLDDLRLLMASSPTPGGFARELPGTDGRRGAVALALVDHLLAKLETWAEVLAGTTEAERVADVLSGAFTSPLDAYAVEGEPLDENGYAYLRMRLGAEVVVPAPVFSALLDEVVDGKGDEETVAAAIRRAGLEPLAVLQALHSDWARGRAWCAGPPAPGQPEAWLVYLRALVEVLAMKRPSWDTVVALHRAAPHAPPGLDAAARGEALAVLRALGRQNRPSSFAAVADATLRALYLDAEGWGFDAEAAFEAAHAAAHDLARALRSTGEPPDPTVLSLLHEVFGLAGRRTSRHWWRRTWDG